MLGLHPAPYSFHELLEMRKGFENEEWDRLSFLLANISKLAGAKDLEVSDFHKFKVKYKGLTKDNIKNMKRHFQ